MIGFDLRWDANKRRNEADALRALTKMADLDAEARARIVNRAAALVERIRAEARPGLMDVFLAQYGLSTDEGVALMCLAEALLRVPDPDTIDALIEDKIAPSDWGRHMGQSSSPLVNASTWALLLTGKVLDDEKPGVVGTLRSLIRRLGEPVIRTAIGRAMRELGSQFVLGQDICAAMARAKTKEAEGFTYSYDMLGEAAMTRRDASRYADAYSAAIAAIAKACNSPDIATNPGISIKLSALHPRYEVAKTERLMVELVPIVRDLARQAAEAGMGFNVDAEEADRLSLSLKIIREVLADPALAQWEGFGVVVQAYGRRAPEVIDCIHDMAQHLSRRVMVRLVKGAYWDTEIKHAQVHGLGDFPVFTRKAATDVSYLANARKLLSYTDRIYPQFATHNAHTVAAILEMAQRHDPSAFEFQRLHGMGEVLHDLVHADVGTRCRIYAPVGAHRDLLAYLVRRLLENGANSSFVNRIVDRSVPARTVAACPFETLEGAPGRFEPIVRSGPELFAPDRTNSRGFDLHDATELARIDQVRLRPPVWRVEPLLAVPLDGGQLQPAHNPATGEVIGEVVAASERDVVTALAAARPWDVPSSERAATLRRASDLFERDFGEIFALLATEAGKTLPDAVSELREAVDFLRYYAIEGERIADAPRGIFTCISPWNFPLAIFTGQVAAALASGNGVLAKPAEVTTAVAAWAVRRLHDAGVPRTALQLVPGAGRIVGKVLTSDPRINGIAFTGSTATARMIQRSVAEHLEPGTPLIAETGGLNAMIVDSTALPEQAVRDIVASAFQSAGQRCSALRCLYVQEETTPTIRDMIVGAMHELKIDDPWQLSTDIGPVITAAAQAEISAHVLQAEVEGRLIHRLDAPAHGHFVPPALVAVDEIGDLKREIFGPVLHIASFKAGDLDRVIAAINVTGYGLTFGIHTRIDDRVQKIANTIRAGNIYANRNQIGAVVGSQPFGGEGLSGTGPKAGGPNYLPRFTRRMAPVPTDECDSEIDPAIVAAALVSRTREASVQSRLMPGPTGELNRLFTHPRAPILCLGPGKVAARQQAMDVESVGGLAIVVEGRLKPESISALPEFSGVLWWGDIETARAYARALTRSRGDWSAFLSSVYAAEALHLRLSQSGSVEPEARA